MSPQNCSRPGTILYAELVQNPVRVLARRVVADAEQDRDFWTGLAMGDLLQHFGLPLAQPQARHHPSAPRFVRTPSDLGALIRERRQKLGLDQLTLAKKAGTSRKWLIEVENGKPRAEIGLILRTLKALRIELTAKPPQNVSGRTLRKRGVKPIDIDSVINFLKSTHERPPPRNRQRQEMRAVALS